MSALFLWWIIGISLGFSSEIDLVSQLCEAGLGLFFSNKRMTCVNLKQAAELMRLQCYLLMLYFV